MYNPPDVRWTSYPTLNHNIIPVYNMYIKLNRVGRQRKEKPSAVGTDDERMEDSDGDDTPTSNTPVTSSRTKLSKRTPKVVKELPFAAHQRDPIGVGMASRPKTIIQNSEEGPSAKKRKMEAKGKTCAIGGKGYVEENNQNSGKEWPSVTNRRSARNVVSSNTKVRCSVRNNKSR
jgi:hypothetical protein